MTAVVSRWIRTLSPRGELLLINTLCFGWLILAAFLAVLMRLHVFVYDTAETITAIVYELIVMAIAFAILRARGWQLADFVLRPSLANTFRGVFLYVAFVLGYTLLGIVLYVGGVRPPAPPDMRFTAPVAFTVVLCIVNPFFEELFVVAYNMKALENESAALAITFSAFVRFLYHVYQGPIPAVTILGFGLAAAALFRKWRSLWPLYIAHVLQDAVGIFYR